MSKNRVVILFGAGAVIPWGGPQTSFLTDLIKDSASEFVCNNEQIKVTQYIYDTLKNSGYTDDEINFETLINVIEELIIYYAFFDRKKELPSTNVKLIIN